MSKTLEERLADAKARRASAEGDADARAQAALLAQVEKEEMAAADAEAVADAVVKYGPVGKEIATVYTDLGVVIVQRAPKAFISRFQDLEGARTTDVEDLVFPNVRHPARPEFEAYCMKQPIILHRCGRALLVLAGARDEAQAGKS